MYQFSKLSSASYRLLRCGTLLFAYLQYLPKPAFLVFYGFSVQKAVVFAFGNKIPSLLLRRSKAIASTVFVFRQWHLPLRLNSLYLGCTHVCHKQPLHCTCARAAEVFLLRWRVAHTIKSPCSWLIARMTTGIEPVALRLLG